MTDPEWAHQTSRLLGLDFDFAVRTTDRALGGYLDGVFGSLVAAGRPARLYSLSVEDRPSRACLRLDDSVVYENSAPEMVVAHLLWHVNRQVVQASSPRYHLFHAAAASYGSAGVLFPAAPDSGKTTLVTALVAAGLAYLTDEAAAVDPDSLRVHPFPKALSLDPGSWPLFPGLCPVVQPPAERYIGHQWQVSPGSVREGAVGIPCVPRYVIAPTYRRGADTESRRLSTVEATVVLARNSFNLADAPRRALEVCAAVARSSACWTLTVGDLGRARDLVLELVGAPPSYTM